MGSGFSRSSAPTDRRCEVRVEVEPQVVVRRCDILHQLWVVSPVLRGVAVVVQVLVEQRVAPL